MTVMTIRGLQAMRRWSRQCLSVVDTDVGREAALLEPLVPEIRKIYESINEVISEEKQAHGERRSSVIFCNEKITRLSQHVGQARSMINYRMKTGVIGAEMGDIYGLRLDRPVGYSRMWLTLATELIDGDQVAVAEGYPPLSEPNIELLRVALKEAKDACACLDEAELRLQQVQQKLRELRYEQGEIILDVSAYLRYKLRRFAPSERRRIMRKYGFSFRQGVEGVVPDLPDPELGEESEPTVAEAVAEVPGLPESITG